MTTRQTGQDDQTGPVRQGHLTGPYKTVRRGRVDREGQVDQDDELVKAVVAVQSKLEATGQMGRVVVDKSPEEADRDYWARQMDPNLIRVVNWSRRRKRTKGLWKSTRSGGGGNPDQAAQKIREVLG